MSSGGGGVTSRGKGKVESFVDVISGGGGIGTSRAAAAMDGVVGGGSGGNANGDDWAQVTVVAYWDTQSTEKKKKQQSSADMKLVGCDCVMVTNECRSGRMVREIGEENFMLKQEVAELRSDIVKLKAERKLRVKMQMAEMRGRDRKQLGFLIVFAACIAYAVFAIWVRGFV